ncbi:hypothetical protein MGYG_07409 [Nannizzia gypsea CBS 118893]|uniref:DNA sliding clamp PCNA n=1 Tax=Arthroderma gypseum (strain ATCC MYA-4604 / CBS 118893) TaxID=535722 RepID=E4V329_ARTGP|nr:hypothetical protein MGYG_07409 [Nannizzia gypsea CBS 118893]EFR04403.1 hypothetical protein MGYG_07409 [Nannizzia gypsea CBS 118893]
MAATKNAKVELNWFRDTRRALSSHTKGKKAPPGFSGFRNTIRRRLGYFEYSTKYHTLKSLWLNGSTTQLALTHYIVPALSASSLLLPRHTLHPVKRLIDINQSRVRYPGQSAVKEQWKLTDHSLCSVGSTHGTGFYAEEVDAVKDLVHDCNFDCNDSGIALQAMDNSHVALVSMMLKAEGFSPFRCDRNVALGINLVSLTKVLRAAQDGDVLTLKADDTPDVVNLLFESVEKDRVSEYDIKLMDIDQEHLAIPETDYSATVEMPSAEFRRICGDLNQLSESVLIEASKDGVRFSCQGEIGNGAVTIRQNTNVDKPEQNVAITLTEPVALTFSIKYLLNFCKATSLSSKVRLSLSAEVPLLVEYTLDGSGYVRFYLAPKIGEDE